MNLIKRLKMTMSSINSIKPILKKELGKKWFPFLISSSMQSNKLFMNTKWAIDKNDKEAKFVKSISMISGMYSRLKKIKGNDEAITIIEDIVKEITHTTDMTEAKEKKLDTIMDPFLRWCHHYDNMINEGAIQFNKFELLSHNQDKIHLRVKRCLFNDFFNAVGHPELTQFICHADKYSQNNIFKEYHFHRNDSWENTIAHDCEHCEYVWDLKDDHKHKEYETDMDNLDNDIRDKLPLLFNDIKQNAMEQ